MVHVMDMIVIVNSFSLVNNKWKISVIIVTCLLHDNEWQYQYDDQEADTN